MKEMYLYYLEMDWLPAVNLRVKLAEVLLEEGANDSIPQENKDDYEEWFTVINSQTRFHTTQLIKNVLFPNLKHAYKYINHFGDTKKPEVLQDQSWEVDDKLIEISNDLGESYFIVLKKFVYNENGTEIRVEITEFHNGIKRSETYSK